MDQSSKDEEVLSDIMNGGPSTKETFSTSRMTVGGDHHNHNHKHKHSYCLRFCEYSNGRSCRPVKRWASTTVSIFFFSIIIIGILVYWINISVTTGYQTISSTTVPKTLNHSSSHINQVKEEKVLNPKPKPKKVIPVLNCSQQDFLVKSCLPQYLSDGSNAIVNQAARIKRNSSGACPEYFRWIHDALTPWESRGITRDMVENGKEYAHFRLVIIKGKAYVEKFGQPYQTRDLFTIWGIVQLLRFYPGQIPDLELMFNCEDKPVIKKSNYEGANSAFPPPVFHYCGSEDTLDIVFPDWTFWGWAETNIKPWESLLEGIREGNRKIKWKDRIPYAYWKGNPHVSDAREDLMNCNVTQEQDWNARLHKLDWVQETEKGFKTTNLADKCTYRYKIYVEGQAWSVSEKYIMACDSMTLLIEPEYYDFFVRAMVPLKHYWPIRSTNKCRDLKFAVDWGNNHTHQAQIIGKAGSKFIQEKVKMKYVYDYMFHLLRAYAKLSKFKPRIPKGAKALCAERMACSEEGSWRSFMVESMVNSPSETLPCKMPPPFEPLALEAFNERKERTKRQVQMLESEYWEKINDDNNQSRSDSGSD